MADEENQEAKPQEKLECFLIMPISDPEGYAPGHFRRVAEDIFRPACEKAGYRAVRADEIREANLIHLDILQKLIDSPMAICDLSTRNPNVLFELGLRQAFDKPVVLVQEIGTLPIFDIAPLRYVNYRKERLYHEVLSDQISIADALKATRDSAEKGQGVNSLVKLLALGKPASLEDVEKVKNDPALQVIMAGLSKLQSEVRSLSATALPMPTSFFTESDEDAKAEIGYPKYSPNHLLSKQIIETCPTLPAGNVHKHAETLLKTMSLRDALAAVRKGQVTFYSNGVMKIDRVSLETRDGS